MDLAHGVSINPIAFLVVQADNVKLLPVSHSSSLDKLLDYVPELIEKTNNTISKCIQNKKEETKEIVKEIQKNVKKEEAKEAKKKQPKRRKQTKPVKEETYEFEYEEPEEIKDEEEIDYNQYDD